MCGSSQTLLDAQDVVSGEGRPAEAAVARGLRQRHQAVHLSRQGYGPGQARHLVPQALKQLCADAPLADTRDLTTVLLQK